MLTYIMYIFNIIALYNLLILSLNHMIINKLSLLLKNSNLLKH
jgi:hypothetical protein